MIKGPRPLQPLDAEERALAKALPRPNGRSEPGPDLDASILASAHAALQPARTARSGARPRIGWIAPASLAASLLLAVGLAWRLRPLPIPVPTSGIARPTLQADGASADELQSLRMINPPAPPPESMQDSAPMEQAMPAPAPPTTSPARGQRVAPMEAATESRRDSTQSPQGVSAPLPAPASAAPSSPPVVASSVARPEDPANPRTPSAAMAQPASAKTLDNAARDAFPVSAGKARVADSANWPDAADWSCRCSGKPPRRRQIAPRSAAGSALRAVASG